MNTKIENVFWIKIENKKILNNILNNKFSLIEKFNLDILELATSEFNIGIFGDNYSFYLLSKSNKNYMDFCSYISKSFACPFIAFFEANYFIFSSDGKYISIDAKDNFNYDDVSNIFKNYAKENGLIGKEIVESNEIDTNDFIASKLSKFGNLFSTNNKHSTKKKSFIFNVSNSNNDLEKNQGTDIVHKKEQLNYGNNTGSFSDGFSSNIETIEPIIANISKAKNDKINLDNNETFDIQIDMSNFDYEKDDKDSLSSKQASIDDIDVINNNVFPQEETSVESTHQNTSTEPTDFDMLYDKINLDNNEIVDLQTELSNFDYEKDDKDSLSIKQANFDDVDVINNNVFPQETNVESTHQEPSIELIDIDMLYNKINLENNKPFDIKTELSNFDYEKDDKDSLSIKQANFDDVDVINNNVFPQETNVESTHQEPSIQATDSDMLYDKINLDNNEPFDIQTELSNFDYENDDSKDSLSIKQANIEDVDVINNNVFPQPIVETTHQNLSTEPTDFDMLYDKIDLDNNEIVDLQTELSNFDYEKDDKDSLSIKQANFEDVDVISNNVFPQPIVETMDFDMLYDKINLDNNKPFDIQTEMPNFDYEKNAKDPLSIKQASIDDLDVIKNNVFSKEPSFESTNFDTMYNKINLDNNKPFDIQTEMSNFDYEKNAKDPLSIKQASIDDLDVIKNNVFSKEPSFESTNFDTMYNKINLDNNKPFDIQTDMTNFDYEKNAKDPLSIKQDSMDDLEVIKNNVFPQEPSFESTNFDMLYDKINLDNNEPFDIQTELSNFDYEKNDDAKDLVSIKQDSIDDLDIIKNNVFPQELSFESTNFDTTHNKINLNNNKPFDIQTEMSNFDYEKNAKDPLSIKQASIDDLDVIKNNVFPQEPIVETINFYDDSNKKGAQKLSNQLETFLNELKIERERLKAEHNKLRDNINFSKNFNK